MSKTHLQTLRERRWRGGRRILEWFGFSLCVGVAPMTLEPRGGQERLLWMQGREQVELHCQRPWPPAQVWGHCDPGPALRGVSWRSQGLSPCGPSLSQRGQVCPGRAFPAVVVLSITQSCPEHPSELS